MGDKTRQRGVWLEATDTENKSDSSAARRRPAVSFLSRCIIIECVFVCLWTLLTLALHYLHWEVRFRNRAKHCELNCEVKSAAICNVSRSPLGRLSSTACCGSPEESSKWKRLSEPPLELEGWLGYFCSVCVRACVYPYVSLCVTHWSLFSYSPFKGGGRSSFPGRAQPFLLKTKTSSSNLLWLELFNLSRSVLPNSNLKKNKKTLWIIKLSITNQLPFRCDKSREQLLSRLLLFKFFLWALHRMWMWNKYDWENVPGAKGKRNLTKKHLY